MTNRKIRYLFKNNEFFLVDELRNFGGKNWPFDHRFKNIDNFICLEFDNKYLIEFIGLYNLLSDVVDSVGQYDNGKYDERIRILDIFIPEFYFKIDFYLYFQENNKKPDEYQYVKKQIIEYLIKTPLISDKNKSLALIESQELDMYMIN